MRKRMIACGELEVSRLGLGTATWGFPGTEDDAVNQLRTFADAGGTLIDTAYNYGKGESERIIGDVLAKVLKREDFVIATKSGVVPGRHPMRIDASRERLLVQLEESMRRLRVEHVDLWQVHAWDDSVPIEETLGALESAIKAGKVRVGGVCNYRSSHLEQVVAAQYSIGNAMLATLQLEYSLLQRNVERRVLPAARRLNLGILPWGPLGRGVLTGKYLSGIPESKKKSFFFGWYVQDYAADIRCAHVVSEVVRSAEELGIAPAAVALSWLRDRPGVIAPLIGARSVTQLVESLFSESLDLPEEIRQRLDMVSAVPVGPKVERSM